MPRFRGRRPYVRRLRNGEFQWVVDRGRSHSPSSSSSASPPRTHRRHHRRSMSPEPVPQTVQDPQVLAENQALRYDNGRLRRDNQNLIQQLRTAQQERDWLANDNANRDFGRDDGAARLRDQLRARNRRVTELEARLERERRDRERERRDRDRLVQEVQRLDELNNASERRFREDLQRVLAEAEWFRRGNAEKSRRIRELEGWLREFGIERIR